MRRKEGNSFLTVGAAGKESENVSLRSERLVYDDTVYIIFTLIHINIERYDRSLLV